MALPNLGTLSLGPASTGAEVPCRHFGKPVSEEEELELAFKRFKAVQDLREQIKRGEVPNEPPGKRVSNRGILSNLYKSVEDDSDDDMLFATSLALGYQRHVGDSWSKMFDDEVQCPESWTTPGPASIIRMRNYNWCYPDSKLDNDRAQSYMLKASLFVDLTQQRRVNQYGKTFPADYINRITSQKFYGTDTEDILTRFLAECETYTFTTTTTRPLYADNTFPPARVENAPDAPDEEDAPDDDSDDNMEDFIDFARPPTVDTIDPIADYTNTEVEIFGKYFERRGGYRIPIIFYRDPEAYRNELEDLEGSAYMLWNDPWEKRLGLLGFGRIRITHNYDTTISDKAYTFWDAREFANIWNHIRELENVGLGQQFQRQADYHVGDTGYTLGERSFKGPNTMTYPVIDANRDAYVRTEHSDFHSESLNLPIGAKIGDCLDITVHVPITARVNLRNRESANESCEIDARLLATPGAGRRAIVILRPASFEPSDLADNEPLHTNVYTGDPGLSVDMETRPNIFLQWLQQNELRKWGVPRTSDGEVNRNLGWYSDFRDSYEFKTLAPNLSSFLGNIFGGRGISMTNTDAVKKVPGANMRDVMVTDSDFYNAEVGEMLPSSLSDLPKVHKVPQGLVFFVDVNVENGEDQDPCRYVDHIMNQCLHPGSEGQDRGCIAWLLDEMRKTIGYEAMANAKVLYSDNHWVSQSTHTATTVTPYERQTGFKLAQDVPGYWFLDPETGPSHSGGVASHRFTAGCQLVFGLREPDHLTLHGEAGRMTRRASVNEARDPILASWNESRNGVVDI